MLHFVTVNLIWWHSYDLIIGLLHPLVQASHSHFLYLTGCKLYTIGVSSACSRFFKCSWVYYYYQIWQGTYHIIWLIFFKVYNTGYMCRCRATSILFLSKLLRNTGTYLTLHCWQTWTLVHYFRSLKGSIDQLQDICDLRKFAVCPACPKVWVCNQ